METGAVADAVRGAPVTILAMGAVSTIRVTMSDVSALTGTKQAENVSHL
jgi:hypothetical protein